MAPNPSRGVTLIELMVVVAIIGICVAIVVPQLVDHKYATELTDLTNMVQQTASQTRNLALQTRRAAVLEVALNATPKRMWINTLGGPKCTDAVLQTNIQTTGQKSAAQPELLLDEAGGTYAAAGAAVCGASVFAPNSDGSACAALSGIGPAVHFALCYSGSGELWVRDPSAGWTRACVALGGGGSNGAVLRFNRFSTTGSHTDCTTGAVDVARSVYLPIGGAPYSKVDI